MNKKLYILIFAIALLMVIISITIIALYNTQDQRPREQTSPTPTPFPVFQGKPLQQNVPYNQEAKKRNREIIQQRPELSDQGKVIRQNIIARLNNISGVVKEAPTYRLEYIQSPDIFMAEILTTDINTAKQDVQTFLLQEGFVKSDICYIPVVFYLHYAVSQSLRGTNTEFSPLPLGC